MNKIEMIEKINKLPKFELKDVAVKELENAEWVKSENDKAVTEIGSLKPITFVTTKYKLVQFDEAFLPLIEPISEMEGSIVYWNGLAVLDIFPIDDNFELNGDKFGIVFINSVNKTSAINIKFCIKHTINDKKHILVLPKRLAGFKHIHVGKIVDATKDYVGVVNKVKDVWKSIMTNFTKEKVDEEYAKSVLEVIKYNDKGITKRIMKNVMSNENMNLWDLFLDIIYYVSNKNYKSEMHKRKRLDKISESIFNYAIATKLIY